MRGHISRLYYWSLRYSAYWIVRRLLQVEGEPVVFPRALEILMKGAHFESLAQLERKLKRDASLLLPYGKYWYHSTRTLASQKPRLWQECSMSVADAVNLLKEVGVTITSVHIKSFSQRVDPSQTGKVDGISLMRWWLQYRSEVDIVVFLFSFNIDACFLSYCLS